MTVKQLTIKSVLIKVGNAGTCWWNLTGNIFYHNNKHFSLYDLFFEVTKGIIYRGLCFHRNLAKILKKSRWDYLYTHAVFRCFFYIILATKKENLLNPFGDSKTTENRVCFHNECLDEIWQEIFSVTNKHFTLYDIFFKETILPNFEEKQDLLMYPHTCSFFGDSKTTDNRVLVTVKRLTIRFVFI